MKNNETHERLQYSFHQALSLGYSITINNCFALHSSISHRLWYTLVWLNVIFFTYFAHSKKQSMRKISMKSVLSREHFQHVWYTWSLWLFVSVWNYLSDAFQSFFSSPSFSFSFRRFSFVFCLCSCHDRRLPSFAVDRSFEKPECRQCSFGLKT